MPFLPRQILVGIGLIEICACLCLMQAGVARHRWGELAPDVWVPEIEEMRAAMIFDEYYCITVFTPSFFGTEKTEHPLNSEFFVMIPSLACET